MSDKEAVTSIGVHDLIARRWSPRALDGEATVTLDQVRALLEAARWAPSHGNTQPARYLVGLRGDDTFKRVLASLTDSNQAWAQRAGALFVACAVTRNDKGDLPNAAYGVGLATENLVLQAVAEGLVARQMAGFDPDTVHSDFTLPTDVRPLVVIAVGVAGEASAIFTEQRDIDREAAPRQRIALSELAFTGGWGEPTFTD